MTHTPLDAIQGPETRTIARFLTDIGLGIRLESIDDRTFLPGVTIRDGVLIIDEDKLKHPGDVLHEAGHLAVVTAEDRSGIGWYVGKQPAEEMAAIAWSWAALTHLELAPEVVFHPEGYKGGSTALIEAFSAGNGPGIPLLEWFGMTSAGMPTSDPATPRFPAMVRWLR